MTSLQPGSWANRPSLIEVAFPALKLSIEAQTERKANAGQTLTALGSYWKGRKPLVLVRACVLGALLPATDKPEEDISIFELLMGMDDDAFAARLKSVSTDDVLQWGGPLATQLLDENERFRVKGEERRQFLGQVLAQMPYSERLNRRSKRPEELPASAYDRIWSRVNGHLGTTAQSHAQLVEQLGTLRFGHRPRVADTFAGGGSIPFEAARLGCDVYASDLNPIACMLTWGAFHIVGADDGTRAEIAKAQAAVVAAVDHEITELGIEHDEQGNRAKAYLYCIETRCPETGWMVPLAGSWVISKNRRCIARLEPDHKSKRFTIRIIEGASDADIEAAAAGTVQDQHLVYTLDGEEHRTPIRTLRGERRVDGETVNDLRRWTKEDIAPREGDVFQERLYCIQWMRNGKSDDTFFREVTAADETRERRLANLVSKNLPRWQREGLLPDMAIEPGQKTDEPIRTRGWTHWHHLFTPRSLWLYATYKKHCRAYDEQPNIAGALAFDVSILIDRSARLSRWEVGFPGRTGVAPSADAVKPVFYNQALNVLYNYGARSFAHLAKSLSAEGIARSSLPPGTTTRVTTSEAASVSTINDIYITDPPYADAVEYHEITEFFIAWLRRNPPAPFQDWVWDSRRDLAIKGTGEDFRREMVKAYRAMADHMPAHGLQIVMFTHQNASVWGDMAGIFWGAGLQVTAAWYIATETTSELKKGGYVQGTVILVLRKRPGDESTYKDELALEIRKEVARQIETLVGLDQRGRANGRSENLFSDADLQMAGYAAALRVLTRYTQIDGTDMTREALRPRSSGERTVVSELIDLAAQIANEHLVPEGLSPKLWERLVGSERFYLRMLDIEVGGGKKLDHYQNFAKAFRVGSWQPLMASMKPNDARLKSSAELKRGELGESEFGTSLLRGVLYAIFEIGRDVDTEEVMSHLRDHAGGWYQRRADAADLAAWLGRILDHLRTDEASAARVLEGLIRNERLGA